MRTQDEGAFTPEEQRKRFLERIDEPDKNWKFGTSDVQERKFWGADMTAYEECLIATSTDDVPWYIVPADDKHNARLIVSQIARHVRVDEAGLAEGQPRAQARAAFHPRGFLER